MEDSRLLPFCRIIICLGFPGGASDKEPACQCRRLRRCGFDPWVGNIPWRRAWQPIPVFFIFFLSFFKKFYFNWQLITLQYCGGFCHTFTWISQGCTCVPHPEPPSNLPPHPIPQDHPSAPALNTLSHLHIFSLCPHILLYFTHFKMHISSLLWF